MTGIFPLLFKVLGINLLKIGRPVIPQEWFCVPFECIEEVVERIKDKSITEYKYDVNSASLVKLK